MRGGALLSALPEAFAAAHAAQEAELRCHEPLLSGVAAVTARRAEGAAGTRERAARAVVDAQEASCALRLALRRQTRLQGTGLSCPLPPGEDVQYLGEHG